MPTAVVQLKVTAFALAADREAVNVAGAVPAFPSVTEVSFTESSGGASSSVIVATPWASRIDPGEPVRLERFTTNVSLGSSLASPVTGTVTTLEVVVFVRETVPDEAVKSAAEAEPGAVAQLTWSAQQAAGRGATWIVKLALTAAPVPSVTATSVIVTFGVGAAAAGVGTASRSKAAAAAPATTRTAARWKARRRNRRAERSMP